MYITVGANEDTTKSFVKEDLIPLVSEENKKLMIVLPSEKEVQEAIFAIHPNKVTIWAW